MTLDQKRQLAAEDVSVTENGKAVSGVAVRPAASAQGIGTVLLIDSSNSMKGSIDDAMAAARTFAARNPGQPLSVVTFDMKPTVVLPFTTNAKAIESALAKSPPLAEGTVMYDALAAAAAQARDSGLSAVNVVLVTDGADVRSVTDEGVRDQPAPGSEDPGLLGRHPVAVVHHGGHRGDLRRDRRQLRGSDVLGRAQRHLRRARLPTREPVRRAIPLSGAAGQEGDGDRSPSKGSVPKSSRTRRRRPAREHRTRSRCGIACCSRGCSSLGSPSPSSR